MSLGCIWQSCSESTAQSCWLTTADNLPARHDVATACGDDALEGHVHRAERRCRCFHCCRLQCRFLSGRNHRMLKYRIKSANLVEGIYQMMEGKEVHTTEYSHLNENTVRVSESQRTMPLSSHNALPRASLAQQLSCGVQAGIRQDLLPSQGLRTKGYTNEILMMIAAV